MNLFARPFRENTAERDSALERHLLDICALPTETLLSSLGTPERGLSVDQVESIRTQVGRNELTRKRKLGLLSELLPRFANPLVVLLLLIAGLSIAMGVIRSAVVVGAMVLISVVLGYIQEARSSKAVDQLRAMVQTTCLVMRDGKQVEIPIPEVVPGDIV